MKTSLLVILLLGAQLFAQDQAPAARTAAGCGPEGVQFDVKTDASKHPIPAAESGRSLVYVFQDEIRDPMIAYIGHPTTRVGLDGAWIGANHGKSYFFYAMDPGEHSLCAEAQSAEHTQLGSAYRFTAEAGKAYYFQVKVEQRQNHQARVSLERTNDAQGQLLTSNLPLSSSQQKK